MGVGRRAYLPSPRGKPPVRSLPSRGWSLTFLRFHSNSVLPLMSQTQLPESDAPSLPPPGLGPSSPPGAHRPLVPSDSAPPPRRALPPRPPPRHYVWVPHRFRNTPPTGRAALLQSWPPVHFSDAPGSWGPERIQGFRGGTWAAVKTAQCCLRERPSWKGGWKASGREALGQTG